MAMNSDGLARPAGERSSLVRSLLAFLYEANPEAFKGCQGFVERVQKGDVKIANVSRGRATELLDSFALAAGTGLPNDIRVRIGLAPRLGGAPAAVVPSVPAAPPTPVPIKRTMREYNQVQQQAKQGEEEFLFVSRSCEAFLAELKSIEDEGDLPVPMVKVVHYEAKTFLLIATAKFHRDFGSTGGYDQVGTAVDHCKPEEHPLSVGNSSGPMVRSNRDRRSNTDPDRVFWVRAIELVGEALVRFWVNPCHRPGTAKSGNQNTFYSILADGSINDLTEEEYKAFNSGQTS